MAKLENLQGKVVWITGASSGIGKALAEECAAQGAQIVLTARRLEELEKVRSGLVNPDQHISVVADITDESQVRTAYEQVLSEKGRIDWLINNAGLSQRALIQETTMQTERAIMEVDYFSQVFSPKQFYRHFKTEIWPDCFYFQCGRPAWNSISGVLFSSQRRDSYVGEQPAC